MRAERGPSLAAEHVDYTNVAKGSEHEKDAMACAPPVCIEGPPISAGARSVGTDGRSAMITIIHRKAGA